jgi:hypothetical protein
LALAAMSSTKDSGVGDTVARLVAKFGDGTFQQWYKDKFGRECGCKRDQANWNGRFRYPSGVVKRGLMRLYGIGKTVVILTRK